MELGFFMLLARIPQKKVNRRSTIHEIKQKMRQTAGLYLISVYHFPLDP
jgi:hypothetical protein